MLTHDQRLFKSLAMEVYGHCKLFLPWLRVTSWWIFLQSGVEKLLAWAAGDWTHNLRSLFSVRCLWPLSCCCPSSCIMDLRSGLDILLQNTMWLSLNSFITVVYSFLRVSTRDWKQKSCKCWICKAWVLECYERKIREELDLIGRVSPMVQIGYN